MDPGEALIFKTYDSLDRRPGAVFTPTRPSPIPTRRRTQHPRQSIESRTLAFFAP